jgi:hypothetical protein
MPRWIQDPVTLELIPAEEYYSPANASAMIMPDINIGQALTVDGIRPIEGRKALREYCARNGVIPEQETKGLPYRTFHNNVSVGGLKEDLVAAYKKHKGY